MFNNKITKMKKPIDFLNFSAISEFLSGNNNSIRKNKIPEKYKTKVNVLKAFIQYWMDNINEPIKTKQS